MGYLLIRLILDLYILSSLSEFILDEVYERKPPRFVHSLIDMFYSKVLMKNILYAQLLLQLVSGASVDSIR